MVKTPSKRSASTAALDGTPVPERVVKLDPGLQSLMDHGDNIEVTTVPYFSRIPTSEIVSRVYRVGVTIIEIDR